MSLRHWVVRGTGTPKDKDEVNRREVCECDGRVCDLEVMGVPSILSIIRKAKSGRVHGRVTQAELLKLQKSGQFPDEPVRIKVTRIHYVICQTY